MGTEKPRNGHTEKVTNGLSKSPPEVKALWPFYSIPKKEMCVWLIINRKVYFKWIRYYYVG